MIDAPTQKQISDWLKTWHEYRTDNGAVAIPPTPENVSPEFYAFYLCVVAYGYIQGDDNAMIALDSYLASLTKEQLERLDIFLAAFHDYMIIMGVSDG